MIIPVVDPRDPRLDWFRWRDRQLASRTDRLESVGAGLFVAEGDLVVDRALESGCTPVALLCDDRMGASYADRLGVSARHGAVEICVGDEALRRDVTGLGVPLRAVGLFRRPPLRSPDEVLSGSKWIVVAEAIDNPTNLGAIMRSAAALGFGGLILDQSSTDPLARRALRVSMGTALSLPFARLEPSDSIAALLGRHDNIAFALTPDPSALDISTIVPPRDARVILLLGSEREGLTPTSLTAATERVRIPMHSGVDSLNVGAAAAIALHHLGPNRPDQSRPYE